MRPGVWALVLLALPGCWQEVHYRPSAEPVQPPSEPVVLKSEKPREEFREAPAEEDTLPMPTADELFAEEEIGEDTSVQPELAPAPEPAPAFAEPEPAPDLTTALAAWRMASKWSLAVGIYGKGYGAERYGDLWQQAERNADELHMALMSPEGLPAKDREATAISILLDEAGPQLVAELGDLSAQHRSLCDLAIKTHALLLIYTPDNWELKPLIAAIRLSAENSSLPEGSWQPLVELLDARADFADVKRAVFQLHRDAEAYLAEQAAR